MHALGAPNADGVFACESCHPAAAESFTDIDCVSCHDHASGVTNRLHGSVGAYDYQSTACYTCHPTGARMAFDHAGVADQCAQCHQEAAPFAALPLAGFTHPDRHGDDCGACHTTDTWKNATGAPPGLSFDPQAAVTVDALIPTYSGTSISSLSPQVDALKMAMDHASVDLPAAALSACANCHVGASSGTFYPGLLHSSLANLTLSQPAACGSCHASAMPVGFVGPPGPNRDPASPEMKHDAVAWANNLPTTSPMVANDCGACHATTSWAHGLGSAPRPLYHASLAAAAQSQPASCIDCHANSRPSGVLTSSNSSLPSSLSFDHTTPEAMGNCAQCHQKSLVAPFSSWAQGTFHVAGGPSPTTCVTCHAAERPTSTAGWVSPTYSKAPFDYVTNAAGITHGDGQDCALCHPGPGTGAWGGTQNWVGGSFSHASTTVASKTCLACHSTQRPDLQPGTTAAAMATLLGFDHAANGSGDCFACHQATVVAGSYANFKNPQTNALPNGDWKGGVPYPGSTFASSNTQFIVVTETRLNRSGANNLVTSTTTISDTLYNGMLHTAAAVPAALNAGATGMPDNTRCWHCHTATGTMVTSFNNGRFHASLTNYAASPGGTVVPFAQPTQGCPQCHAQAVPSNIVQKAGSNWLQPMDHAALFTAAVTIAGASVTGVPQMDCATCHQSPGQSWAGGVFHANIGTATPQDCVSCHYPLMADPVRADLTSGTTFAMKHRSAVLGTQSCASCHTSALGKSTTAPLAATLWKTGALHAGLSVQPSACADCHTLSRPAPDASTQSSASYALPLGGTATNSGQWHNHGAASVVSKDCVVCHAADAKQTGSAWSKASLFHPAAPTQATCQTCHGLTNGHGAVAGASNNLPVGLTNSSTVTSASASTGVPAGTFAQMLHTEANTAGRECNACHSQSGPSSVAGVQGTEWAQAKFHPSFSSANPLLINGSTARCSNCHLNVKPGAGYTQQDHLTFSSTAGTQDCSACHSYPGTGSALAANWLGATGTPTLISVGGFGVTRPPAAASVTQGGIAALPHPTVAAGVMCTTCHLTSGGGRGATGYDHASALIATNCNACHEAGTDLLGTPWNNATTQAAGAGDSRPFSLTSLVASYGNGLTVTAANHFYPVDCNQCHVSPTGISKVTTGAPYASAWDFPHTQSKMTNPSTCVLCHVNGIPGAPVGLANDPNASVVVTALVPRYSGTSIAALTAQSQTLPMSMDHASTQFPAAASSTCSNCHDGATSSVYYPGALHSSLANLVLAEPTSCTSCHPASVAPKGFVGPTATSPARSPASPEMKHDAVSWAAAVPTSTALVPADCGLCHLSPSQAVQATWATSKAGTSPATYHPALAAASQSQPGSCVDCHANSRPTALLTSSNATLTSGVSFDHQATAALGDCASCHVKSTLSPWASWAGGRFHLAGSATPATCVPCHSGERPTTTTGWVSTTYRNAPFDYGTNASGVTHGDGLDCVSCHASAGTGAWGSTQNWVNGNFVHGPASVSSGCLTCHSTQRPDLQPGTSAAAMATLLGFDHAQNGTGDCSGCHQATVVANSWAHYFNTGTGTLPNGDWKGGVAYPGSTLASAGDQFITLTEVTLNRSGANNLVTSTSSASVTLYNSMLHTSAALPSALAAGPTNSPDNTTCWHCHTATGTTVTSFKNGQYHPALTNYRATPGGTVAAFSQPTARCADCHAAMLPANVVQKAGSSLLAMDHAAQFTGSVTLGGASVTQVSQADCSVCHQSPGATWSDGLFHANIGAAVPKDCVGCHYLLMADSARADVTSGTTFAFKHKSAQLTFQGCDTCHPGALAKGATTPAAATLWQTGAYHGSLTTQPGVCLDCHAPSEPAANGSTQSSVTYALPSGSTTTNGAQWLNHGASDVAGKDCAVCHAADARKTGSAWSKADLFHPRVPSTTACNVCHGLTNGGGAVAGTRNNLPQGLTNSATVTSSAGGTTGIAAGTLDQVLHTDVNVAAFECTVCHTQAGVSSAAGVQGKEWAQAKFHVNFSGARALVMNTTTGRCSNCHLNLKPGAAYVAQNHGAFTNVSGSQDCSSCHSWPGTGTASTPNWLGAAGMPQYIAVGGFTVPKPPAPAAVTRAGINNLPHPVVGTSVPCTTCHQTASGGKNALGYDHLSALINSNCGACHEAGSNLVGTPWNNATGTAGYNSAGTGAGDTRPFTLASVTARYSGNTRTVTQANHFYPVDCYQCHVVPAGNGLVTTGTAYIAAWNFPHTKNKMTNPGTCVMCHTNGIPN